MKHKILILSPGRQTYLIALFERYFDVYVGDYDETTLNTYYNLPSIRMPKYDSDLYLITLLDYIKGNHIEYVMSLSDIEVVVLSENEEAIKSLGSLLIALPYKMACECLDKYMFAEVLLNNRIDTPKTYIKPELLLKDINNGVLSFPVIVKNRWGMGSRGLCIVHNERELYDAINAHASISAPTFLGNFINSDCSLVFQEMIQGQEFGIDIVNDLNRKYFTHLLKKKIEMRGGETDIAQITSLPEAKELAQKISSCFMQIGNLDCDFIYDGAHYYVIDINPRFGGGYIFSVKAGLNVPELLYKWISQDRVDKFIPTNVGKSYRKITDLIEIK